MSEELERILARLTEPDNAVIQQVDTYMNTVILQNSRYGICDSFNNDYLS